MNQDRISLLRDSTSIQQSSPESRGYESLDTPVQIEEHIPSQTARNYSTVPQYVAAIAATLSAVAAGFVLGWTSPVLDYMLSGKFNHIPINSNQMGWIGSFATLGAMTMCIPTGFICDLLGRKKTLLLLIFPLTLGWLLIIFAQSIFMIYFGRLITGMAVGACCVAAPLYTNEIAQKEIRGTLGSYFQLMIVTGIFLVYFLGEFLSPLHLTITAALIPFIFILAFMFQPESPIYLLKRGRYDEAQASLAKLRGTTDVVSELTEIEGTLKESSQVSVSIFEIFRRKSTKKALIIAMALMFFQQFSGINAVILYSSKIFKSSGINLDSNVATILVGLFQVIATFISSLIVDRLGRKILLLTSSLVMAFSSCLLAIYFSLKYRSSLEANTLEYLDFLPIVSLSLFIVVFSLGLGPIPWIISSEIFPSEIKSMASSSAGTFNWFLAFIITKFYLQISNSVGMDTTFYVFSVLSLFGGVFVHFIMPETKGKTIDEILTELN